MAHAAGIGYVGPPGLKCATSKANGEDSLAHVQRTCVEFTRLSQRDPWRLLVRTRPVNAISADCQPYIESIRDALVQAREHEIDVLCKRVFHCGGVIEAAVLWILVVGRQNGFQGIEMSKVITCGSTHLTIDSAVH